jgi:drug/metabolite transporter (DMT)-like permease
MTGVGLLVGSLIALPLSGFQLRKLLVPKRALFIGVYGLLGFHLALFAALQLAPAVQANLLNYLWPLLLVLLAPLFRKTRLRLSHVFAGLLGFAGAAIAILSSEGDGAKAEYLLGYVFATAAAVIWASYSLLSSKLGDLASYSVGSYASVSGLIAIGMHFVFEAPVQLQATDIALLILMGLGPLGGAFYLWDYALKHGNPQRAGIISFATPVLSTTLLLIVSGQALTIEILIAAVLIILAAAIGRSVK